MAMGHEVRDAGTRQRLVDVTVELIAEVGVDEVRLKDVLDRSGLSNGSLYWFFKNRRSLIDAALAERFVRRIRAEAEAAGKGVRSAATTPEAGRFIQPLLHPFSGDLAEARAERIAVLAGALADPALAGDVAAMQRDLIDRMSEVVRFQQHEGYVRGDIEAEAMAVFIQVVAVGLASLDVDSDTHRMGELWEQIAPLVLSVFRS